MNLRSTGQQAGPPTGKPVVIDPVLVTPAVPVYFAGDHGPVPVTGPIYCSRLFATTVIAKQEAWALAHHFALVHVGVYNPRKARHADGTPIEPPRWSNHAYGGAEDWKGVITENGHGQFLTVDDLQTNAPAKYRELIDAVTAAIKSAGKKPEIVDEGGWVHLGMYPQ